MRTLIDEVRNLKTSHELLAQQHKELVEKVVASSESRLQSCPEQITETMKNISIPKNAKQGHRVEKSF